MTVLASFVTAHGFGHAARAAAVIEAVTEAAAELDQGVRFEIFTTVPRWFFAESVTTPFGWHELETDVGLVQRTALAEDLEATVQRLARFLPLDPGLVRRTADELRHLGCEAVLCDISPLGLAAASAAGLPSILIESFTWDWIYRHYLDARPGLAPFVSMLEDLYAGADLHIRALPACSRAVPAREVEPIARRPRTPPATTRRELEVPAGQPLVLVTMGGVTWQHEGLEALAEHNEAFFVVPGASDRPDRHGSLLTLPHHSRYYHPDLVHAADLVVGKIGYSTLAETLSSGAGFLLVARPSFPESEHLIDFASSVMPTRMLTEHQLQSHSWLELIPTMAAPGDRTRREVAGAAQAARAILDLLDR